MNTITKAKLQQIVFHFRVTLDVLKKISSTTGCKMALDVVSISIF